MEIYNFIVYVIDLGKWNSIEESGKVGYSRESSSSILTRVFDLRLNTFRTFLRRRAVSVNLENLLLNFEIFDELCNSCGFYAFAIMNCSFRCFFF